MKLPEKFWLKLALVVVSGLMFFSIFMPTLSIGSKKEKHTYSAYQYMKGMTISDEQLADEIKNAKVGKENRVLEIATLKRTAEASDKAGISADKSGLSISAMKAENAFLVIYSIISGVLFLVSILFAFGLLSKLLRVLGIGLSSAVVVVSIIATIISAVICKGDLAVSCPHFALIYGIIASIICVVLFVITKSKAKAKK